MRGDSAAASRTCAAGLAAILCVAATAPSPATGAGQEGQVTMEKVEYGGWANNLRISNGDAELIVTLDVGPRILSYRLTDGQNVFKEFPEELGKTGEDRWIPRGGHRLWTAPEDLTRTYAPDNGPVQFTQPAPGVAVFRGAPDAPYGIQKEIEVRLAPSGSDVTVVHRITNIGSQPTDLSVWALTVMKAGGVEIVPLPEGRPHPGPPENAKSPADYAPDRLMVLWPFTDMSDPRWHFGKRFITLRQDAERGPTKLGLAHRMGWAGYLVDGTLFVKHVPYVEGAAYPDWGCNYETFSNEAMLEMESLGPLVRLNPGVTTENTERWELIPNVGTIENEADIEARVLPKLFGR